MAMAKKKQRLTVEEQTAMKVKILNPEYWGWFEAVHANFIIENLGRRAVAMTIPQGQALGIPAERWTAWQFNDGHVEVVRASVLGRIVENLEFPDHLAAGCFPHVGGTDWFLIRETDRAMTNITRVVDDLHDLTSPAVH